jgi:hypothetical protein
VSILATDDFAGTGALSASWSANDNNSTTMSRSSGQAISDDATNDAAYRWSAIAWPADQYSQVILGPATAGLGSGYGVCVRMDTAGTLSDATHDTFYRLVGSAGGYERIKLVGAAGTSLESSAGTTFTSGDTLYMGIVGTQATFKKNGVAFGSPASDSAIASGASGIGHSSTSNVGDGIASWEGGDFAAALAALSTRPLLVTLGQRGRTAKPWVLQSYLPSPPPYVPPVPPTIAPLLVRFAQRLGRQQMGRLTTQTPGVSGPNNFSQVLTATLDFVGALVKSTAHTGEAGALSFAGALVKRTSTARTATLSFAGSQARSIGKVLTGALSFAGARAVRIAKGLTGTLSFTGSVTRAITLAAKTATLNFAGALVKSTSTARTATLSFAGSVLTGKAFLRAFTATLSFSGALAKLPNKALAGALSFAGVQSRAIVHTMSAALAFAGSQARRITLAAKTATLSFAGSLVAGHLFTKALTATLSFAGAASRRAGKALAGSLSFVGARGPTRIGKALAATLGSSGVLARVSSAVQAVFGWGARGHVGGAAAHDPFQRLGSESARDPWQRIGSESADDPFKRIGAESAKADTGAIGGESAQGTPGKIGSDEA